jgi:hypothetical protein
MSTFRLHRRDWLKTTGTLGAIAATNSWLNPEALAEQASQPVPLELGSRRELLVDDYLVDAVRDLEWKLHRPEPREVVITCDAPWEGNTSAYFTLFADDDRFRMYYRGSHFDEAAGRRARPEVACYAESRDGIHWEKPALGLFEFAGSKENNIVLAGEGTHNFTPFKDTNPACPPEARYKALAGNSRGLKAYQSADGIHWSLMRDEPVITDGNFDSQNLAFWHPEQQRYLDFHRKGRNRVRDIMTCGSEDFLNWTAPEFLEYGEAPAEHLYTNAILLYPRAPQLFVGFPTRFQPRTQQVEPILMTSRDGRNFRRWDEPLIPITAPEDRDGNRSNYLAWGLLQLPGNDRELSVYAKEAYYTGPGSRLRRFTFRTDGFVSLAGGTERGELVTKPFRFTGSRLSLNCRSSAGGSLRVELQDASGQALPGRSLDQCATISGDEIDSTVRWGDATDVGAWAGQPVRLRFAIQDAELFALQFIA